MDERSIRANSVRPDGYSPKKKKKKRRLPWYFWVLVSLLMLAAAALTAVSVHYRDMFYPHTEILGVDVSSLGAPEAAERLSSAAGASVLSLGDGAGPELCRTALADYLEDGVLSDTAAALLAEQHRNPLGWLNRNGYAYAPALLSELTAERTAEVLDRALYGEGEPVRPRDARVVLGETGFELEPEVDGDLVDVDRCAAAVAEALRGVTSLTETLAPVVVDGARILPAVYQDDPAIQGQIEALNAYLTLPVSVEFSPGNVYVLTAQDIWAMSDVSLTEDSARCEPNIDKVRAFSEKLIADCHGDGLEAKYFFTAQTRDTVYYRDGDAGWTLDRDAINRQLYAALKNRTAASIHGDYDYTSYWINYYHCVNTFIEISLDNQYLWFYVNGKLLVETPVVTGNIANHDDTRRGFFWVTWRTTDTYLQGPTWYDHVDFWMPFDDQIGLHDSSWRDEYGGDIYLTDGSHGCVNTPLAAMATIYNNSREGTIVIVY